jgi:hypothetical protein
MVPRTTVRTCQIGCPVQPGKANRSLSGSGRPITALWISCAATVLKVIPLPPYPSTAKHRLAPGTAPIERQPGFARPEASRPRELGPRVHPGEQGSELPTDGLHLRRDQGVPLSLVGELFGLASHDDPAFSRRAQIQVGIGRLPDQATAWPKAIRLGRRGHGPGRHDLVPFRFDQAEVLVTGREDHVARAARWRPIFWVRCTRG